MNWCVVSLVASLVVCLLLLLLLLLLLDSLRHRSLRCWRMLANWSSRLAAAALSWRAGPPQGLAPEDDEEQGIGRWSSDEMGGTSTSAPLSSPSLVVWAERTGAQLLPPPPLCKIVAGLPSTLGRVALHNPVAGKGVSS